VIELFPLLEHFNLIVSQKSPDVGYLVTNIASRRSKVDTVLVNSLIEYKMLRILIRFEIRE
jgi:hypothetical protein